MEDEGQEVAGDEEAGDEARREVRYARAVNGDDSGQTEVDGGGKQGGANGQTDKVDYEVVVVEVVDVQLDAARVADNLEARAADHGDKETPSAVADGQADLCEEAEGEEGEVKGIAGEGGDVADLAKILDGASRVSTEPGLVIKGLIEVRREAGHCVGGGLAEQ